METTADSGPVRALIRRGLVRPVLARLARAYVAGERLDDALAAAREWARRGIPATLGFWDGAHDTPRGVAAQCARAIGALAPGDYASVKLTALGYSEVLLDEVAEVAARRGVRLHFDAMELPSAERTRAVVDALAGRSGGRFPIGVTLPGCWSRSVEDAAWAAARQLHVRVVKGQFPQDPAADRGAGFRRVVDALAGRARHVGVASHDVPLAAGCLERLAAAGTPHELELLHGLPTRASLRAAAARGQRVRVYVAYGKAHFPYVVDKVIDNPWMVAWMARDFLRL